MANAGITDRVGPIVSVNVKISDQSAGKQASQATGAESYGFDAIKQWASETPLHRRGDIREKK